MRFNLSCVYWILLLISVISSCLLFIIVASEGIKLSKDASTVADDNDEGIGDATNAQNATIEEENNTDIKDPAISFAKRKTDESWDRKGLNENNEVENDGALINAGVYVKGNTGTRIEDLGIFNDVSTQQPNLSQGVPESDQTVVLTLVDAAAAELQSLAEPRLALDNNRGMKSVIGNLSIGLSNSGLLAEASEISENDLKLDKKSIYNKLSVKKLSMNNEESLSEARKDDENDDDNVVVIVRADQTGGARNVEGGNENDDVGNEIEEDAFDKPNEEKYRTKGVDELSSDYEARVRISADEAAVVMDVVVPPASDDPPEDIPSFSEWAQKRLEEAEKKKTHPNASSQNPGGPGNHRGTGSTKVRSKNYASPDCGAKIVAANPEAGSASSVLSSSRDEYMLNTCTSRVWFVVELCEAIQAEKIELANFELFSSSPKDFTVWVGDRFPSRDWSNVGKFTANDERDIQNFHLYPRLFGKFVKVELQSHYGSEHFCPVSLFRVYGTSEFEVLETENQIQESMNDNDDDDDDDDDDEEEMLDSNPPRNLFGSARDAVLSIVKKAAQVLVKSGNNGENGTEILEESKKDYSDDSLSNGCATPKFTILCNDCKGATSAEAFRLITCHDYSFVKLLRSNFINETLSKGDICIGSNVNNETKTVNYPPSRFLAAIFPKEHIIALCNIYFIKSNRKVVNASLYVSGNSSEAAAAAIEDALITPPGGVKNHCEGETIEESRNQQQQPVYCTSEVSGSTNCKTSSVVHPPSFDKLKNVGDIVSSTSTYDEKVTKDNVATQIKPTKTLDGGNEDSRRETFDAPVIEPSRKSNDESTFFDSITTTSTISPMVKEKTASSVDKILEEPVSDKVFQSTTETSTSTNDGITDNVEVLNNVETDNTPKVYLKSESDYNETEIERDNEQKILNQEHISLDTLLSDLKDLEADAANMQNSPSTPSTTLSQPQPTPQQKESVFLRLSNRIKTLERNMSLSGQYLEELSKRYKKQVEEMQRSLERAITTMGEESRRSEEREARRLEEIVDLREQISTLSRSLVSMISERESWRSKFSLIGQHVVLVSVEIVIVLMVISYCRRSVDFDEEEYENEANTVDLESRNVNYPNRRKSVDVSLSSKNRVTKAKKRRPSEIASNIVSSGSCYRELLINDKNEDDDNKKEKRTIVNNNFSKKGDKKRNKRKRSNDQFVTISNLRSVKSFPRDNIISSNIPGGTNLPSRRASSSETGKYSDICIEKDYDIDRRPVSAPETRDGWFSDQKLSNSKSKNVNGDPKVEEILEPRYKGIEEIDDEDRNLSEERVKASKNVYGGILKNKRISSPGFMKTALVSRSKRIIGGNSEYRGGGAATLKSDNWEWYSRNSLSKSSQEEVIKESPSRQAMTLARVAMAAANNQGVNGFSNYSSSTSNNGRQDDDSDDSGSRSTTPSSNSNTNTNKQDKKIYGIKKMVKKLF